MNRLLPNILLLSMLMLFISPTASAGYKFYEDNDVFYLKYLKQEKFDIDTSASAIVIYQSDSWDHSHMSFVLHKVHKIIKILNKKGLEMSNVNVWLPGYKEGNYSVNDLKGTTYNLDNGTITRQKMETENTSTDKNKLISEIKFSMPGVREGSIIEYSYTIQAERSNLIARWEVQENIPKLYCELDIAVPKEYDIAQVRRYSPVYITLNDKKTLENDDLPDAYAFGDNSGDVFSKKWVRKNVKAILEESYLTSINDYKESMIMYINGYHVNNRDRKFSSNKWPGINKMLLERSGYNRPIVSMDLNVNQKAKEIAGDESDDLVAAKKIFRYVNREYSATKEDDIYPDKSAAKVMSDKSGSPTEINFLLIAMLRHMHYSCSPVILATSDKGTPSATFPELYLYNHVICELRLQGKKYYLDASEKEMPFGALPSKCYNGYARIIDNNDSGFVIFSRSMMQNKGMCMVTTTNNSIDDYTISYKMYFGQRTAIELRRLWRKDTSAIRTYIKDVFRNSSTETVLKDYSIKNLDDPDSQLTLDFNVRIKWDATASMLYYDPYIFKFFNENPFKEPSRKYQIDMPYNRNSTYVCKLQLPKGYVADEIPKPSVVTIDDSTQCRNIFDYDKATNTISIDTRLQMPRTTFKAGEHSILKEFIQKTIEEQQKVVVIKKQA